MERNPSPSKIRLGQLSQKLSDLQSNIETTKTAKLGKLFAKIGDLDAKIQRVSLGDQNKIRALSEKLVEAQETANAEKKARELLEERHTKELKLLEQKTRLEITSKNQTHLIFEENLMGALDDNLSYIHQELLSEKNAREQLENDLNQELTSQINGLTNVVDGERDQREAIHNEASYRINEEFINAKGFVQEETERRKQASADLEVEIDSIYKEAMEQLDKNRAERLETEDMFIKLIEETMARVEMGIQFTN